MAQLSANTPVGESSYGSAGPGYRVEDRVQAAATEYYVGQILVADSGLVRAGLWHQCRLVRRRTGNLRHLHGTAHRHSQLQ